MRISEGLLPGYDHVIFEHACLELCVAQLKYPPVQRFHDDSFTLGVREALANEYPLVTTEQAMNIGISAQGVIGQLPGASMLRFTSVDSHWSVVLSGDFVSLETRGYSTLNEFATRFAEVLRQINTYFNLRHQLRFGLRYINEFRHPEGVSYETWKRLLNSDLLGVSARGVFGGPVEQTIEEARIRRPDGFLLVRHGFLHGTTVIPMQQQLPKAGYFYLLDLDYYDETPATFDVQRPVEQMYRYNDILYRVFRWSIGEGELYRYLREGS